MAFEQYENFNAAGYPCSLITGEEETIRKNAKFQASTVEMFTDTTVYPMVVLDEAQMIADKHRGWAWTAVILGACCEDIHVCLAPSAENIITKLINECGDTYEIIRHERKTQLLCQPKSVKFPEDVKRGDALIVFSKRNVHAVAYELRERGVNASIIYGNLPYDVRQNEAKRFRDGETEVLVSTDAIGMGLNLPIHRVLFLETTKFDGKTNRELTAEEFKQIAGRAGRMGIFPEGYCAIAGSPKLLAKKMDAEVPQISSAVIGFPEQLIGLEGKLSKIIRQWDQLPTVKGYVHSDTAMMRQLAEELENCTDNKEMIYRFVTIPFNEKTTAKQLWKRYFQQELEGEHYSFEDVCRDYNIRPSSDNLSDLELYHKLCDLSYAYCRKFGHTEDIEAILKIKDAISKRIMFMLSAHKLEARKCKYCGKKLAWNYPYSMCNGCYSSRYRRYSDYDDYDYF